jgi:hypothetical protein
VDGSLSDVRASQKSSMLARGLSPRDAANSRATADTGRVSVISSGQHETQGDTSDLARRLATHDSRGFVYPAACRPWRLKIGLCSPVIVHLREAHPFDAASRNGMRHASATPARKRRLSPRSAPLPRPRTAATALSQTPHVGLIRVVPLDNAARGVIMALVPGCPVQ